MLSSAGKAAKPLLKELAQVAKPETALARLQLGLQSAQKAVGKMTEGQLRYVLGGKGPLAGIKNLAEAKTGVQTRLLYAEQNLGGAGAASEYHSTLKDHSGFLERLLQVAVARKAGVRDASKVDFTKQTKTLQQLAKDPHFGNLVEALSTRFKLGVEAEKLPAPKAPRAFQPPQPSNRPPSPAPDWSAYKATPKEIADARRDFPSRMGPQMSDLYDSVPDIIARQKFEAATAKKAQEWGLPPVMPNVRQTAAQQTAQIERDELERRMRGI